MDDHQNNAPKKRNNIPSLAVLVIGGGIFICLCMAGVGIIYFRNSEQSKSEVTLHNDGSGNSFLPPLPASTPKCSGAVSEEHSSKELESMVKELSEEINHNPNNADAYYNRGEVFTDLGELEKALSDYSEAIRLNQNCAAYYAGRANIHNNLDNPYDAIEDSNRSIEIDPSYAAGYGNRGYALGTVGNYQASINNYDEYIRLKPGNSSAYTNRGWAYSEMGQYDRALADYRKALEIDPHDSIAQNNIELIESLAGNGGADTAFEYEESDSLDCSFGEIPWQIDGKPFCMLDPSLQNQN